MSEQVLQIKDGGGGGGAISTKFGVGKIGHITKIFISLITQNFVYPIYLLTIFENGVHYPGLTLNCFSIRQKNFL